MHPFETFFGLFATTFMGKITTSMIFSILLQMLEQCAATKRTASTCKYPFVNVTNHFQQSYHYFEKKSSFYDLQHSYADAAAVWSNKKNMDKQYTLEKIITNILLAITRCSVLTFSDHFTAINLTFFEKLAISWFTVYLC